MRQNQIGESRAATSMGSRGWAVAAAAAGVLVGLGVANQLLARRAERRWPARGRFIEVDGVRLHYLEAGDGPAVVLLHGNGSMAEEFVVSGLFQRLAESCRVIAMDRPGYGYSERPRDRVWSARAQADLLHEAFIELGLVRPIVVGHSWGTLPALELALEHQASLAGVVLMSGYYRPSPRPDVAILGGPATPILGDAFRLTLSPLIARLITPLVFKALFAPASVPDRFRKGFPTPLALRPSQLRASAAESAYLIPEAARLQRRLADLDLPTLVIVGDRDHVVRSGQSDHLADRLPGADVVRLEGGHMIHHIHPAAVAGLIGTFATRASKSDRRVETVLPQPTSVH